MENKFERAAASLEEMIGEMTNDDGSLDDFIEHLNLANTTRKTFDTLVDEIRSKKNE